ncbi:MAG: EAL domain-containing protein [Mariprofundaceae bacterium]|nr:EAL domain-containing protein [Mariprofundaceae bacterium]
MKPMKAAAIVMATTVLVEAAIMVVLEFHLFPIPEEHSLAIHVLLDALILGAVMTPVVYFFLLIPLQQATILEQESMHMLQDELTKLPNIRAFRLFLERETHVAKRHGWQLAVIVVDPTRLSEINQIFGHEFGDMLLKKFAQRLAKLFRESDIIGRLSGDEFGLLLPNADLDSISILVGKITASMEKSFQIKGIAVDIGVTMGIAVYPVHTEESMMLHAKALLALSKAKQELQPYALYDQKYESAAMDRIRLFGKLRQLLSEGGLKLHYQPKVDMVTDEIAGVEALIRWEGMPELAAKLIPFAEQIGMIGNISRWVIDEAVQQVAAWQAEGLHMPVAINISARDLQDEALVGLISKRCAASGVDPGLITIEVTESAVMRHPKRAAEALAELRNEGFCIAIDDFGTGHSSLAYLKDIPANELKIDQSFIRLIADDERESMLVKAVAQLGKAYGMAVVAEGVETAAILEHVKAAGCDLAQGYHLARPMPANDLLRWIRERTSHGETGDEEKMRNDP